MIILLKSGKILLAFLFIFLVTMFVQPAAQAWPPGDGARISSTHRVIIYEVTEAMMSELSNLKDTAFNQQWSFANYDVQREAVISYSQVQARQDLSADEAITFDAICNKMADRRANHNISDEERYFIELTDYLD
jgi:hypothetical protein